MTTAETATTGSSGSTGTWPLLRFLLLRDRIKLPAWCLGIGLFVLYYATALPTIFATQADLEAATAFTEGPVGALLGGPAYGFDAITLERFLVGQYGLYFLLAVALMNILLVSRHTRVEEQEGRTELIRANPVGAYAPLNAALLLAVVGNVAVTLLVGLGMLSAGFDAHGSFLFGAGVGALGLVFAGLTALTAQLVEYSRAASGLSGAALGLFFVIRAAGDSMAEHGSWLSWFSPLAWSQQTRPFVDERWWPLGLSLALAAALAGGAYALAVRRDVGAGLVAPRPGLARAQGWLASPLALAWRLQRPGIVGWGLALFAMGLMYGALTDAMASSFDDMPEDVVTMLGGDVDLLNGYLATMAFFMAVLASCYAVLAVSVLRSEEQGGRTEPVLATATSRWAWMGGHLVASAAGVVIVLLSAGVSTGIGAALSTGDAGLVWPVTVAHLGHVPGVLVVVAVAAVLFGLSPRLVSVAWVVPTFALIVGFFGPLANFPDWMADLSPFSHLAQMPLEDFAGTPFVVIGALALVGAAAGLVGYRRRDLSLA